MKHGASVRVPAEVKERLDALSRKVSRDASEIAAEALNDYLDGMESENPELFASHDSVTAWLSSWGTSEELEVPNADIRKPA